MSTNAQFTQRLRDACQESIGLGYTPTRMIGMLNSTNDGVAIAKRLVVSGDLQEGLKNTIAIGREDLAVESIMQERVFAPLFTKPELAAAKWRLDAARHA